MMDENPYQAPKIPGEPLPKRRSFGLVGSAVAAVFGAAGALFVTAPMGAIDGGGDYYAAYGAIIGVIGFQGLRMLMTAKEPPVD